MSTSVLPPKKPIEETARLWEWKEHQVQMAGAQISGHPRECSGMRESVNKQRSAGTTLEKTNHTTRQFLDCRSHPRKRPGYYGAIIKKIAYVYIW